MKKICCALCILFSWLFLVLLGPAGTMPALADVEITDHMMTNNPQWDTGCSTPIPVDGFDYTDIEANCWFSWKNGSAADEISCQWYTPDGALYAEQKNITLYASGCWYTRILIRDHAPANMPGEWRVEVFFAGALQFTEHFTLYGDPNAGQCPAELIYGENSEEADLLRYLRDSILRRGPDGRAITALYYRYSQVVAHLLREDEKLQQAVKIILDTVLELIKPPIHSEKNTDSIQTQRQLLGMIKHFH